MKIITIINQDVQVFSEQLKKAEKENKVIRRVFGIGTVAIPVSAGIIKQQQQINVSVQAIPGIILYCEEDETTK